VSLSILIIDDEPYLPRQFARFLNNYGYEVVTAGDGEAGLKLLQQGSFDLVLLDLLLPKINGMEVLKQIRAHDQDLPVIMLTAYAKVQDAVEAMKSGASDYLLKGFELDELLLVVQRAFERSALYRELRRLRQERSDGYHFGYVIGHSERMRGIFDLVARVARSDASVLITGESGTGKEVIARAIHEQSEHAAGPFHPLNCAAIASSLLESELFGYEQGAFTDARKQKKGLLELAEGGTLFLDEIGEMPLEMQAKLLRVLESRSFYRLGGNRQVTINTRVLAATNRDLDQAMKTGAFRPDLFFRLAVFQIALPPLRERPADVLLFASRFIEDFNKSLGRTVRRISPEAQRLLLAYNWPGNIRELKNAIERAMILNNSDELLPSHLPYEIAGQTFSHTEQVEDAWERWLRSCPPGPLSVEQVSNRLEAYFVRWALATAQHNRGQAAELLGLAKVDQLRYLMRKHGID
jgi:two-component system, NtrC family, response regulator AtoC